MAFSIHWKAPLQPKGFLRIIEIVLAILAFALTAGFSVENNFSCSFDGITGKVTLKSNYPYTEYDYAVTFDSNDTQNSLPLDLNKHYSSGAEFFVAWGVLSMIYCLVAILLYMLITANEELARVNNILIVIDLGLTIFWAFMWFVASIAWAAESHQLQNDLEEISTCDRVEGVTDDRTRDRDYQTFVQANISIVFGFLNCFVWACHVWWVLIDTSFYQKWREGRGHRGTSEGL